MIKLIINKQRINISARLYEEILTIFKYEWNYDIYFNKVLNTPLDKIMEVAFSLRDGREVVIYPD